QPRGREATGSALAGQHPSGAEEPARNERPRGQAKAYHNPGFLNSKDARALRMLAEYLEPKSRFDHHRVEDTVVFMGSARIKSHAEAQELVRQAEGGGDLEAAQM